MFNLLLKTFWKGRGEGCFDAAKSKKKKNVQDEDDNWCGMPWGGAVSTTNTNLPPHPLTPTAPFPPLRTNDGPGRLQDRHTKQQIKASSSKRTVGSRRVAAGGRRQRAEQCVCVRCVCEAVGHSCWVEGIRSVCGCVCVFGGVWPLSESLHRETSAFHKCIKVWSQRDKNTQRQRRGWEVRAVLRVGWQTRKTE